MKKSSSLSELQSSSTTSGKADDTKSYAAPSESTASTTVSAPAAASASASASTGPSPDVDGTKKKRPTTAVSVSAATASANALEKGVKKVSEKLFSPPPVFFYISSKLSIILCSSGEES